MSAARVRVGDVLRLERREVADRPAEEYDESASYSFGKGIFHREPNPASELGDKRFFRIEPGDLVLSNIPAGRARSLSPPTANGNDRHRIDS